MRWTRPIVASILVLGGCASGPETTAPPVGFGAVARPAETVRLVFVGDVMLGREVAPMAAVDPIAVFAEARPATRTADLALFNLESPLTTAPHLAGNPNDLRADPALADALAGAGFDVANLANNHTGDAGTEGIADTIDALTTAGITPLGVSHGETAQATDLRQVGPVTVGLAAFTMVASDAGAAGVEVWEPATAERIVRALDAAADVVAVSFHGGSERIPVADDAVVDAAHRLVEWGADVVWGHGPHVPHPVTTVDRGDSSAAVVATSLGNFLFDQRLPATRTGLVLEVMATPAGPVAYRVGETDHRELRIGPVMWRLPQGDAVLLDGEWWTPLGAVDPAPIDVAHPADFPHGDVTAAAWGDVTGDGIDDLVVAYRHAFRETPLNRLHPERVWHDDLGRSAHLGVFTAVGDPVWGAGTLADPIDVFAPCDGAVAVEYRSFAGSTLGTGALRWLGFGLSDVPMLPGPGIPGCADVDGDGLREVVITARPPRVVGP